MNENGPVLSYQSGLVIVLATIACIWLALEVVGAIKRWWKRP